MSIIHSRSGGVWAAGLQRAVLGNRKTRLVTGPGAAARCWLIYAPAKVLGWRAGHSERAGHRRPQAGTPLPLAALVHTTLLRLKAMRHRRQQKAAD